MLKQKTIRTYKHCMVAALRTLNALGPGQSEKAYEHGIKFELYDREVPFISQLQYHRKIKSNNVCVGIVDIEVAKCVILELKAGGKSIDNKAKVQATRYLKEAMKRYKTKEIIAAVLLFDDNGKLQFWRKDGSDLISNCDT